MPARDLSKKEKTLFYINIGLIAFALIYSGIRSGNNLYTRGIVSVTHNYVAQIVGVMAIGGIIFVLMAGQFSKAWDLFYIILQILCILGFCIGILIFLVFIFVLPESFAGITDPETMESIKQTAQSIRDFLDRNPDFPALFTQAQELFDICGFYEKTDVLGSSCPYSSPEVCGNSTSLPFLDVLLQIIRTFITVMNRNLVLILIIEIVVFVFLVIAYRSIGSKELKKVTYPTTETQTPLITEAKIEHTPANPSQDVQTVPSMPGMPGMPGMPVMASNGTYVYNQPAVPLNYQPTIL